MQPLLMSKNNNYYNSEGLFVAFATQYIMCMLRILLSSVACLAVPYFPTLSIKWQDFLGKKYSKIDCVFWFSTIVSEIVLIIRRVILKIIVINVQTSSYKVRVILVIFQ